MEEESDLVDPVMALKLYHFLKDLTKDYKDDGSLDAEEVLKAIMGFFN